MNAWNIEEDDNLDETDIKDDENETIIEWAESEFPSS